MTAPAPATDAAIAEMEALVKAATPGPWEVESQRMGDTPDRQDEYTIISPKGYALLGTENRDGREGLIEVEGPDEDGIFSSWNELSRRDAAFIAAAREFVPAVIARVRAETKRAECVTKAYEQMNNALLLACDDIAAERAKVARLEAEVAKLREALKPFAEATLLPGGQVVGLERFWFTRAVAVIAETADMSTQSPSLDTSADHVDVVNMTGSAGAGPRNEGDVTP